MSKIIHILSFVCIILILGSYHICEFVYGNDLENWWKLRMLLINISFLTLCTIVHSLSKDYIKVLFKSLIIICAFDIIDRVFLFVNYFLYSDWIIIILVTLLTLKNILYVKRRKRKFHN